MTREGAAAHRPDISTAQLIAEYRAGDSTRTIGARHHISHTAVVDRLKEAGEPLRRHGPGFKMRICAGCGCSFRPKWPEQTLCKPDCKGGKHGATCKRGHLLTPENLSPRYGHAGSRCRTCMYLIQAQYRARKKESLT